MVPLSFPLLILLSLSLVLPLIDSTLIAVCTSDAVLFSAPESLRMGSVMLTHSYPTIHQLHPDSSFLLAIEGDPSDCNEVLNSLRRVNNQHRLQFNADLSLRSLATHCARLLHSRLREAQPLQCKVLLGGVDMYHSKSPELYWVDEIGALQSVRYGVHGKEMPLIISLLDASNRQHSLQKMSLEEGAEILTNCWRGVRRRTSGNVENISIRFARAKDCGSIQANLAAIASSSLPTSSSAT